MWGRLQFNETPHGELAFGMVKRGELNGISAGYRVTRWRLEDEDGEVLDPENTYWNDGDALTYFAERWELLECSCVNIAADLGAGIRDEPNTISNAAATRARMRMRQRMSDRMSRLMDRS